MQKSCKSLIFKVVTFLVLATGLGTNVRAEKTLMWLADWYQMGNIDTITKVLSVNIPHFNGTSGYYNSLTDQQLALTNAYAASIAVHPGYRNDTLPDSLKIPTQVYRNWYALSNFNTANYQGGRIRVYLNYYALYHMPLLNSPTPKIQIDRYPQKATDTAKGQTDQLEPAFTNACIDSNKGDTVWFWTGALTSAQISSNATGSSIKCLDHNPFFTKVGTVHVLNPWPGKTVYAQVGDRWYPLYQESGRQGWMSTTLWTDPRNPQPFKIRLANGDPTKTLAVQYMDAGGLGSNASGVSMDFTTNPGTGGEVWIIPPTTTTLPTTTLTAPPVALTLYIKRPAWSASAIRVLWKGNESRFVAASTKYCDWFLVQFYKGAVPTNIALSNPIGDTLYGSKGKAKSPVLMSSFTDWIDITAQSIIGGTFSLNTDATPVFLTGTPTTGGLCETKTLAFSAYDFHGENGQVPKTNRFFYEPFSQTGPIDNCPESGNTATKGFVLPDLVNGLPAMNSLHKATCGIDTKNPDDDPKYWFDTLWRSSAGAISASNSPGATQLNSFYCVRLQLKLDAAGQYYSYSSTDFWPLNAATSISTDYRNATGNDYKFAMHAKSAFEYVPGLKFEFIGDDDVWIFINKKLVLDVGGQHGPNGGTINVDNLGLVEGKSYQFDMFYTEREGMGSSISIKTTMNLVPVIDVKFDTSKSTATNQVIDSWVTETTADASRCPEEGATSSVTSRPGNPTYALLQPDGSEQQIDSIYAANMLPGTVISQNGSHFEIDTAVLQKSGKLTMPGLYQIRIDLGSESRVVSFSIVSKAVNVTGWLFDSNGDGQPDSVVLHAANSAAAFKTPISAMLHWADRTGKPNSVLVPAASLVHLLGDSVMTGTFLLPARTSCPPTGCLLNMGVVNTGLGSDTIKNPIVALADFMAPVADSAWLVYDTTKSGKDTLYILVSEDLAAYSGLLPPGDSAFVLAGRKNAPRAIPGKAILVGNLLKLPLDPGSNPIQPGDSVRLGGYSGDGLGNAPGVLSKWVPLKADPVAHSWMLDVNGDGYPDSVGIDAKGSLATASSVDVHWKTAAGIDTVITIATPTGVTTGLKLPAGILKNATFCAGCYLELNMGTQTRKFPMLDSVAPVALNAKLRYGSTYDTLFVTVSEHFEMGSAVGEGLVSIKATGSNDPKGTLVTGTGTGDAVLQIVVAPGSVDKDSLRLRGWILGNLKKAVGENSPFVKIEFGPQPIRVMLWDKNGDGMADSVSYQLTRSAAGAPAVTGFGLKWGGVDATIGTLTRSPDNLSWSGKIGPLPLLTSPFVGDQGWLVVGSDVSSFRAVVEDSIAPVARTASLVFGLVAGDADTVIIKGSENMVMAATGTYALLGTDSAAATPTALTNTNSTMLPANGDLKLVVAAGSIANDIAWVRLGSAVSDGYKSVGASSSWVRLVLKPSGRAYLFDANGDGRADSMYVYMRGGLNANQAVLHWKTAAGLDTVRTWGIPASVGPFGVHLTDKSKWFDKGATSCSNCTVTFLDDLGNPIVDWSLIDSVAPMAISGKYSFGTTQDTLVVTFSESLKSVSNVAPWLEWGNTIVGGTINQSSVDLRDNTATFYLTPANGAVDGWDSLRLAAGANAGNVTDAGGKKVGAASPWAEIVYGIAPFEAYLSDPAGVGRGTNIRVKLSRKVPKAAVSAISSFRFSWTNATATGLDDRTVAVSDLTWDGTSNWTGVLSSPFAMGQTGCVGGCSAVALANAGNLQRGAALQDSVPPSATWAKFHYSQPEVAQDTLILGLSESWVGEHPGNLLDAFATVGRIAMPVDVANMTNWILVDGNELRLVVPASFAKNLSNGDSARLAFLPQGSRVWDAANNHVGVNSRWVPIAFGLRPPRLSIEPYPKNGVRVNTAKNGSWDAPPATFPQIELLVSQGSGPSGEKLVRVDGMGAPINDTARTLGVVIKINRPLEGVLIVYDNMGTAVVSVDLNPMKKLWEGQEDQEKTIIVSWNGTGPDHKFAASGIYLLRAVVKFQDKDGNRAFQNLIWKLGFQRDTK